MSVRRPGPPRRGALPQGGRGLGLFPFLRDFGRGTAFRRALRLMPEHTIHDAVHAPQLDATTLKVFLTPNQDRTTVQSSWKIGPNRGTITPPADSTG